MIWLHFILHVRIIVTSRTLPTQSKYPVSDYYFYDFCLANIYYPRLHLSIYVHQQLVFELFDLLKIDLAISSQDREVTHPLKHKVFPEVFLRYWGCWSIWHTFSSQVLFTRSSCCSEDPVISLHGVCPWCSHVPWYLCLPSDTIHITMPGLSAEQYVWFTPGFHNHNGDWVCRLYDLPGVIDC